MDWKFSEFRESVKSLKYELMVNLKILSPQCYGNILVSNTICDRFKPFYCNTLQELQQFRSFSRTSENSDKSFPMFTYEE